VVDSLAFSAVSSAFASLTFPASHIGTKIRTSIDPNAIIRWICDLTRRMSKPRDQCLKARGHLNIYNRGVHKPSPVYVGTAVTIIKSAVSRLRGNSQNQKDESPGREVLSSG
jgi:hypothetical protein